MTCENCALLHAEVIRVRTTEKWLREALAYANGVIKAQADALGARNQRVEAAK